MSITSLENRDYFLQGASTTDQKSTPEDLIRALSLNLKAILTRYLLFIIFFFLVLCSECIVFVLLFHTFAESMLLGIMLGTIFLTFSSGYLLRLYLQSYKREKLEEISLHYLEGCRQQIDYQNGTSESHINLASLCHQFVDYLKSIETNFLELPKYFRFLLPIVEKLKLNCCWRDFFVLKELLLNAAIQEHMELVIIEPTSLDVHASLANAYTILSTLYVTNQHDDDSHIPEKYLEELEEKFRYTAECAIEEFKVIRNFAPNDPWVHTQMAYSYQDLQMPEEETKQYEILHRLLPHDIDSLYKLGLLYFQQGKNAKGLQTYETLRKLNYQKAEQLIRQYGLYQSQKIKLYQFR